MSGGAGGAASPGDPEPEARTQYGALPHRFLDRLEVMLISSRETRRWIIPKGWPIEEKAPHVCAALEARQEAGLEGTIGKKPLGFFHYEKRLKHDVPVICRVDVFPLLVQKQRKKWREKKQRVTRWMLPEEAAELVWEPELRDLILRFAAAFRERQRQA